MAQNQVHHIKSRTEPTGWIGWAFFASFMMMLSGTFQALYGLIAIFNNAYFTTSSNQLIIFDLTTWGWIHLVTGALIFIAGLSILSGSLFGRVVGVIMAFLSAIVNISNIATYPIWSVIVITIDVLVIYALTAHGYELKEE